MAEVLYPGGQNPTVCWFSTSCTHFHVLGRLSPLAFKANGIHDFSSKTPNFSLMTIGFYSNKWVLCTAEETPDLLCRVERPCTTEQHRPNGPINYTAARWQNFISMKILSKVDTRLPISQNNSSNVHSYIVRPNFTGQFLPQY